MGVIRDLNISIISPRLTFFRGFVKSKSFNGSFASCAVWQALHKFPGLRIACLMPQPAFAQTGIVNCECPREGSKGGWINTSHLQSRTYALHNTFKNMKPHHMNWAGDAHTAWSRSSAAHSSNRCDSVAGVKIWMRFRRCVCSRLSWACFSCPNCCC